jgi:hypothetical protein
MPVPVSYSSSSSILLGFRYANHMGKLAEVLIKARCSQFCVTLIIKGVEVTSALGFTDGDLRLNQGHQIILIGGLALFS